MLQSPITPCSPHYSLQPPLLSTVPHYSLQPLITPYSLILLGPAGHPALEQAKFFTAKPLSINLPTQLILTPESPHDWESTPRYHI